MHHSPPQIAGTSAGTMLLTRLPDLVRAVLDALVAEIPVYGRLPEELIEGDVRSVVDRAIRMFIGCIEREGVASEQDLVHLSESAVRRAEEGVPMEMVLAAYFRGARICVDAVGGEATAEDLADFVRVNRSLLSFMEQCTSAVAAGYARFGRTSQAEKASSQQLLVNALLDGSNVRDAANRAGMRLPSTYLVLSISAGRHRDEDDPEVDPNVAGLRKLRRLREELDRHYAEPVLWVPSTEGGLALVPHQDLGQLRTVMTAVQKLAGTTVHAGVVAAAPEDVPAAAELAREVNEVARSLGRPGGVYELHDVALEYQLSRASRAQPMLAALLAPLDDHPDLSDTLNVFLAQGLNRRKAASVLHVHPNTVDNRLRRVASLTGLDPASPADLPTITAALAARRPSPLPS